MRQPKSEKIKSPTKKKGGAEKSCTVAQNMEIDNMEPTFYDAEESSQMGKDEHPQTFLQKVTSYFMSANENDADEQVNDQWNQTLTRQSTPMKQQLANQPININPPATPIKKQINPDVFYYPNTPLTKTSTTSTTTGNYPQLYMKTDDGEIESFGDYFDNKTMMWVRTPRPPPTNVIKID